MARVVLRRQGMMVSGIRRLYGVPRRKERMKTQKTTGRRGVSRRDFFRGAGAGLLASDLSTARSLASDVRPRASRVRFTPRGELAQISPNLYVLHDSCNVYVVRE